MKIVIDIPDEQVKKSLEESKYINEDEGEKGYVHIAMLYTNAQLEFVNVERKTDFYSCEYKILQKGHGDLIDRKKLQNNIDDKDIISPKDISKIQTLRKWINNQNPIIEADKAESEGYAMNGELYPGEFEAMERQGRLDALIPEQKMMTSEEAIKILTHEINEDPFVCTEYRKRIHEALAMAIEAIKQTRWIPVSKRLPEEDTYVLITTEWEDGSTEVGIDSIVDGKWVLSMLDDGDTVTAWMPLPEPYKEVEEK